MGIFGWIIFGFVVGLLARAIETGNNKMGFVPTTILGIVGALTAGAIGRAVGWYDTDSGAGLIAATLGAIVVLAVYKGAIGRRNITDRARDENDRFAA